MADTGNRDFSSPSFASIISAPETRALLQTTLERATLYRDFARMPMPEGATPEMMWRFVMMVQHSLGVTQPIRPWFKTEGEEYCWYYLPKDLQNDLTDIAAKASGGSRINHLVISNMACRQALLDGVYEEVALDAQYDGIHLTAHAVEDLWNQVREPENDGERIIRNFAHAFSHTERFAKYRPFSRLLVEDIQDVLLRGVTRRELDLSARSHWTPAINDTDILMSASYGNDVLDFVAGVEREARSASDWVMMGIVSKESLQDTRFVPHLGNLTEYLLRCAYHVYRGMPVLCFVPVGTIRAIDYYDISETHEQESFLTPEEGFCATWNYMASIKSYVRGIADIERALDLVETRQKNLKARVTRLPNISARQKAFLIMALSDTSRGYSIKQYIGMYGVAYSTAHKDIMELVDLGYLSQQKTGSAYRFHGVQRR